MMEPRHDADTKLEDLPEDVVWRIISCLHMRNVARASASCSTFLRCWATHPHLTFDEDTLRLPPPPPYAELDATDEDILLLRQQQDEHARCFVHLVDAILLSRRRRSCSDTAALESLTLSFAFLREQHAPLVDRWVRFALASTTTRRLKLDLAPHAWYNPDRLRYAFPCSLLSAGTRAAAALEHLYLRRGTLVPLSQPPGLTNLATLVLANVRITGEDLERFLSSCNKLQSLELRRCHDMEYVTVSPARRGGLTQLRFLTVECCFSMTRIDVSGSAIESLRLVSHNLPASLLLGSPAAAPPALNKLTSASFRQLPKRPRPRLELLSLAHVMPGLESLSLTVEAPPISSSATWIFHHLKHLDLYIHTPGRYEDDDLLFMYPFLDAAPALEELSLQLFRMARPPFHGTQYIPDPDDEDAAAAGTMIRKHRGLPHRSLMAVDITGFDADLACLELVLHILEKARALRRISLEPTCINDEVLISIMAKNIEISINDEVLISITSIGTVS